jgi:hypothetical protein
LKLLSTIYMLSKEISGRTILRADHVPVSFPLTFSENRVQDTNPWNAGSSQACTQNFT